MSEEVPVGRLISIIVSVLAAVLVLALCGIVLLAALGAEAGASLTLTHIIETILGVFIGIAAGRLASEE
jgi:hypothetical protein